MGQGQLCPRRLQSSLLILFSPHPFTSLCQMSPFQSQSTIFLPSELTRELNSELLWIDGVIDSAFHEDTFRLLEGVTTTLDHPPILPNAHLLPSFEDYPLGPHLARSGDGEHDEFADFTTNLSGLSLSPRSNDPYVIVPLYPTHHSRLLTAVTMTLDTRLPTEGHPSRIGMPAYRQI